MEEARDGAGSAPEERDLTLPLAETALLPMPLEQYEGGVAAVEERAVAPPFVTRLEQQAVDELSQLLASLKGRRK